MSAFFRSRVILRAWIFALLLPWLQAHATQQENTKDLGLRAGTRGEVLRDGREYRAIGVNYFNAFYRTILNPEDRSYREGLQYLGRRNIPFIRFSISGFWPSEYDLYMKNRDKYFALLDEFVRTAEREGVGLIPSLFWNYASVPDLVGEPVDQWANPASKTTAFMREFTMAVVKRYSGSPAIWAWEFGNEANAYADLLDQAARHRPETRPASGTPARRTQRDDMSTAILKAALSAFASTVRRIDSRRLIFSGNDIPPPNGANRYRHGRWQLDSKEEYQELLLAQNPDPIGTVSIHLYPHRADLKYGGRRSSLGEIVAWTAAASRSRGRVLFIGEFGAPASLGTKAEKARFREILGAIEKSRVPLAALWVFDFAQQDGEWNVSPGNPRAYQLAEIARANARITNRDAP